MSERFTASNGLQVYIDETGMVDWDHPSSTAISEEITQAFREYFMAERDRELGRERVEGYPDFVIYPTPLGAFVIDERESNYVPHYSKSDPPFTDKLHEVVARAWFAAQEPPKCKAALNIKGEHFGCDKGERHGGAHGNTDAGAIWGEAGDES